MQPVNDIGKPHLDLAGPCLAKPFEEVVDDCDSGLVTGASG
jgi:hypothetical protein